MRRNLLLLAAITTIACGSVAATGPTDSGTEVGTYTLVSLGGRSLPVTIGEGSTTVDVLSGSLTLGDGGALRMIVVYRTSGQTASVTNDLSGRYTRSDSTLSFTYANGGRNSGSLAADTITMTNEGVVWLFRRGEDRSRT